MANFEGSHLRKTFRLKLPAEVVLENKRYTVLDWSYGGFRIQKSKEEKFEDKEYPLLFILHFEGFSVELKAKAKLRWQKEIESGFEFTDLSDSAKKVMKEYMEAYIEGRLTDIGGIISEIEIQTVIPEIEPPLDKNLQKKLDIKLFIMVSFYLFIALILLTILYIGFKGTQKVYSIDATYIADISFVTLEEDAKITKIFVQQGQDIKKGDRLFEVSIINQPNPVLDLNILRSKIDFSTEQYNIDEEIINLTKERENIKIYIDSLNQQLKNLENKINLYKDAAEKGYISSNYLESINQEKQRLLEQLLAYQINLSKIDSQLKNLKSKKDILKNESKTLNFVFSQKNFNTKTYFSNTDGRILNIQASEGSIQRLGFPIILIEEIQNKGCFMARFDQTDGRYIKVGDTANVYIPSIGKEIKGIVVGIGKMSFKEYRYISEFEEYNLQDLAVKICFDNVNISLRHGEKAEAYINVKRLPWLLEILSNFIKR